MMPLENIADWEQRLARQDAFWQREILDRPVVVMAAPKEYPEHPWPAEKTYASHRDRWMDTERTVEEAVATTKNLDCFGDALPLAWPNLGPEVFSAFFGIELEYTADTSWAVPVITDWADAERLQFSKDNFYWKKLVEMTDALLEAGKGLYYVGISDLHPGGDGIAAFRDPMDLNTDLLLHREAVEHLLAQVNAVFLEVFDFFYTKLDAGGQACTSWPGIVSSKKWYVPSNDFSCMISEQMFNEIFLPGIVEDCRRLEASIYHLDGPDALRHLDSLLAIDELNAIQWVYGAGNGRASNWIPVYQRCQAANKGIQLEVEPDELECVIEHLEPEGVWLHVSNIRNRDHAEAVLDRICKWT